MKSYIDRCFGQKVTVSHRNTNKKCDCQSFVSRTTFLTFQSKIKSDSDFDEENNVEFDAKETDSEDEDDEGPKGKKI